MFRLTHELPPKVLVAVSGGVDSIAALHWLCQKPGRVAGVVHVNHNSGKWSDEAEEFVRDEVANEFDKQLWVRKLQEVADPGRSLEQHWREQRYRCFWEASVQSGNLPVVVAHNFDDCVEEYMMATMVRGFSGTIPYEHFPCIRPFRLWKREDILRYAQKHELKWVEDPSNAHHWRFKRAYIRHKLVPEVKVLNPGIYNIVERVMEEQDKRPQCYSS